MENYSINRVELRGRIGQEPKISTVNGNTMCRFSLATSEIYKDKSGDIREDTTWHSITAWMGKSINDFSMVQKGAMVVVTGRIRNVKYTAPDGEEHKFFEVLANTISPFSPQTI